MVPEQGGITLRGLVGDHFDIPEVLPSPGAGQLGFLVEQVALLVISSRRCREAAGTVSRRARANRWVH